ncbi:MAG: PAS domain S-box protein [Piscinibacter sp.]
MGSDLFFNYVDRLPDGVALCRRGAGTDGAAFQMVHANPALRARLGPAAAAGTLAEALGPLATLLEPALQRACTRPADDGRQDELELFDEARGHWFAVSAVSPMNDHVALTFRDVTAYKVASACAGDLVGSLPLEASLARSEARQNAARLGATLGSWDRDLLSGEVLWSPEMFEIYGLEHLRPTISAAGSLATVHPEDRKPTLAALALALREQRAIDITHRVVLGDGRLRHVRLCGQVSHGTSGRPLRASGTAQDVTLEVTREAELREGEARLRTIFSAMSEGLVIHDRDGRVVDANAAAAPLLGLTHDQLLGRSPLDPRWQAVHEDGTPWPGQEHPAMVTLRTGQELRMQTMGVTAPGQGQRWISINASPLWADGGSAPSGVVASFNDVTPRLQLKQRMQRTEAELTDLYDNAPCGYHALDAGGRYLRINATELSWLGCTRDEVIGRLSPSDFFSAQSQLLFREHFPRLAAGECVDGLELELIGRCGTRRWVRLNASVVRDADGRFVATRSILHDITELRRSRDALQRINAEQAQLLDNELIGMVRVRNRHFTWVNRGTERLFGYRADELVGQPTRTLYESEADHAAVGVALAQRRAAGKSLRVQVRMRRRDGRVVWIDISTVPLSEPAGESLALLADITAMKVAEEERIRSLALESQNLQLHETVGLKNQFLASMSHELRTPLNAVIGFTQLLKAGVVDPGSPKQGVYLDQIESSGRHLLQLIEAMLDYANAESGLLALTPEPLDLDESVRDVLDALRARCERRQVSARAEVDASLTGLRLDRLRLRQVLLQLIDNAVKFSRPAGRVEVRALPDGPDHLRIEVHDQGIGIAESDLPSLFTPFHQLSAGPTKAYEGTGLGLALVRRLVEAQGGSVGVRSTLGLGSVFSVRLPRQQLLAD